MQLLTAWSRCDFTRGRPLAYPIPMSDKKYYAVLTGDIINSSHLSKNDLEEVRSTLLKGIDAVKGWERGLVKGKPEFFRGDAWQVLLSKPALALRAAVLLRAALLSLGKADSRISIGLGTVESISAKRVSLSTGEAFFLSGHALDGMTGYAHMTIEAPRSAGAFSEWLPLIGHLCDSLIGQWTQRQAEIVYIAADRREFTHEKIAHMLTPPVSKQAVTKVLNGANWYVIREAIHRFEKNDWQSILNYGVNDN